MKHFAKLDNNNKIIDIIVSDYDFINTLEDKDSYIESFEERDETINPRKRFAQIGAKYDPINDVFLEIEPIFLPKDQIWYDEYLLALNTYKDFFNITDDNDFLIWYFYTIFDIENNEFKGRSFRFFNKINNNETLIKVNGTKILEIYHRIYGENKSITYDLETKKPIFYYLNNDLDKYDYYTDEFLGSTNVQMNVTEDIDLNNYLEKYPFIKNIIANSRKTYGYVIEYREDIILRSDL